MFHFYDVAVTLRVLYALNADLQIFGETGIEIHPIGISSVTGVRRVDVDSVIAT